MTSTFTVKELDYLLNALEHYEDHRKEKIGNVVLLSPEEREHWRKECILHLVVLERMREMVMLHLKKK